MSVTFPGDLAAVRNRGVSIIARCLQGGSWLYFNFFFQNIEIFLKLDRERWKVWTSEQYLQCLVQSVCVFHSGCPLTGSIFEYLPSVRWMGGFWAWPIGRMKHVSCLGSFLGLWSTMILALCTPRILLMVVQALGIGTLDKKEFYQIFVILTCVLWLSLIHIWRCRRS